MPHRAEDGSPPRAARERVVAATGHPPVVDLVAGHLGAERLPAGQPQHLLLAEGGRHVEQPEPGGRGTRGPLDPVRVGHGRPEHLEPAADPEHGTTARGVGGDRVRETGLPQPGQVGERRPGAGEHHHVGGREVAGLVDEAHPDAGLEAQRVDVGEVADPRQHHHGDPERVGLGSGRPDPVPERQRVLGVQPQVRQPGQHAQHRPAGELLERAEPGPEQAEVAAELVDHEAGHQRLVLGVEQGERAVHGGEDAAAVDVADEHRRDRAVPGQAHVDEVVRPEVDLGRAAGPLADHDVVAGGEVVVRRERRLGERRPARRRTTRRRASRPAGPRTTTWLRRSLPGLSRTGFIADSGSARAASACTHCARPISEPSAVTIELLDMFCALNGATRTPRRLSARHSPVVTTDLPASEVVPATRRLPMPVREPGRRGASPPGP